MPQTLLLIVILVALAWWSHADARSYRAFRLIEDSVERCAFYRRWTFQSFLAFGLGGLALLALTGSLDTLRRMPAEFATFRPSLESARVQGTDYLVGMLIGGGLMLGLLILSSFLWARRMKKAPTVPVVGDIEPMLPRNGAEIAAAIPMAINAGIVEELFFRLALPLLATQVTGSALAGFTIACIAFALAHGYQGWKGMLFVCGVGGWFAWLYLSSGSLLKPMLVHALIDLIAMAVRPAIMLRLRGRAAA